MMNSCVGNGVFQQEGVVALILVIDVGREVLDFGVSGWLAPNRCQISKLCIGGATNAAAKHTAKPLHPMKHLLGTWGQPGACLITRRSHPEKFKRLFARMQHAPICLDRQE